MTTPTPLTTTEAAAYWGLSRRQVQRIAQTRGVGLRVGRDLLFRPEDLDKLKPAPRGRPRKERQP
jgi:excisionase family DNA binding protein